MLIALSALLAIAALGAWMQPAPVPVRVKRSGRS